MSTVADNFDATLIAWLQRQAVAEERLTSFAFRVGQPDIAVPEPTSHAELRSWIISVVTTPAVSAMLRGLGDGGRPIPDIAADGALGMRPGDRVSLAARIGVLAAGGLVLRELETDRVHLTELGRAALALLDAEGGAGDASVAEGGKP